MRNIWVFLFVGLIYIAMPSQMLYAKNLKAQTTLTQRLKNFTNDFKSKRNEKKYFLEISNLPIQRQRELLNRYDATVSIINPTNIPEDKLTKALQKSLNNNVKYIIQFYDSIHSWTPDAEKIAIKHEKKVPELKWTKIMQIEKQEWQIADIKATFENAKADLKLKWYTKEIDALDKEIDALDKEIAKNKDELAKNKDELAKNKDELVKILNKLNNLLNK